MVLNKNRRFKNILQGFINKIEDFYKSLGNNLPKPSDLDGGYGIEIIYCISSDLNYEQICKDFGITTYSSTEFLTDENKFNNKHIVRHYGNDCFLEEIKE